MKQKYISLMARSLAAYTDGHIQNYYQTVKTEGLTEHGFPRLTANIGILIAHGIRRDLLPLFCRMMDVCCQQIPRVKAANEFSVREILLCLGELESHGVLSPATLEGWRSQLAAIDPLNCYDRFATAPTDKINNWACFTAVSEFMRQHEGLCDSSEFIDTQLATQLSRLDDNGMYRDPHEPMVYDLVPRGLFAMLLHFGYNGRYRDAIDRCLRVAGLHTLKMQSVTGEIPFGGRSNQCLFNEALMAIVFEYEASRYAGEGNMALAGEFKYAVARALEATEGYLGLHPVHHVKNRFPLDSRYGCEGYAYFDKYMITAASYLYSAYLLCDDTVPAVTADADVAWQTSPHFHKVFLRRGEYALELDTDADPHYDASGLGRVHRRGAPSAICMSLPCAAEPKYKIDIGDAQPLSLCPAVLQDGEWHFATDSTTKYHVTRLSQSDDRVTADISCLFDGGKVVNTHYTLTDSGVDITVCGEGDVGYMLPAFSFDGENKTVITAKQNALEISYMGWVCRYSTDAEIFELDRKARNRNGHYRTFLAEGKGEIKLRIEIDRSCLKSQI